MTAAKSTSNKLTRHRERMRAAGLRPVQFWVPDTRAPEFVALVRFQCQALAKDPAETEVLGFAEQAASLIASWE
jgi:hypothetical protein